MTKLWRNLPFLWIVFGVLLSCASYYGYQLLLDANGNAEQMTHSIESKKSSQRKQKKKVEEATYCPRQIKPVTPTAYAKAQLHYVEIVNQWGVGSLFIPSADIHSKILAGIDNQNLMVGVGTYYKAQQLGKGNVVLLAHNLVQGGGVLGNLRKTGLQQVFYLTDFTDVFEYVAEKNEIVDKSRGDLLDIPHVGKSAIVTLIRCEGGINTSNRAIVQGTFLKKYPASEAAEEVKAGLGLTEGRWISEEVSSDQQSVIQESTIPMVKEPIEKTKKPIYSTLQVLCIYLYTVLNETPIIVGIGYLVGLLALTHIATRIQCAY
ncbi:class A sortase [Enterococcus sp. DIV0098]|uniref:class A sortase n=1 Tax=Enterococcus sp. DIV0098 TaxID=2774843 RepID=UPI003F2898CE